MDARLLAEGRTWDYTPGSDVSAGDVVVIGNKVGIAATNISSGDQDAVHVRGIGRFPKSSGSSTAITQGALCYWDAGSEVVTTTAGSNKFLGLCAAAATTSETTVDVDMTGAVGATPY